MNLVSQRVTGGMLLPLVAPFAIARKATDRLLENKGRDGPDHDDHDKKRPRDLPFPFFMSLEIQDSEMFKMCYLLSLVREELSNYAEALSPLGVKARDTTLADFCESCDPNQVSGTQSKIMKTRHVIHLSP